jgi:uncharacterized protein with HEPN domain
MIKDDTVYLGHMLDQAHTIAGKVQGKTRAEFDADENLRLALAHLVQTIGEAARRVSDSTKTACPEVPWRQIMGMRHRIVHDYMNVDSRINGRPSLKGTALWPGPCSMGQGTAGSASSQMSNQNQPSGSGQG